MSTSLDSRLGQLFILELETGKWGRGLEKRLQATQPAGALIPARHIDPRNLCDLPPRICGSLQATPFIGLCGDSAQPDPLRMSVLIASGFPYPDDIGRKGGKAAGTFGKLRGAILRLHGCNVDFSLSLDLAPAGVRTPLASTTFSSDAQIVSRCGAAYVRALREAKIYPCANHFPGMGSVGTDPQSNCPTSVKPMAALWQEDLKPFRELLQQLPLLMVSPACYKAYDFDLLRPAMLSTEVVQGLLRVKLGYGGIVVANLAVLDRATSKSASRDPSVEALRAGCDLLIVEGSPSSLDAAIRAIRDALEAGTLSEARLEESLAHVDAARRNLAKPDLAGSPSKFKELVFDIQDCLEALKNEGLLS